MKKLRELFTKWYIKRGYSVKSWDALEPIYYCPRHVKPLLFLFSIDVYVKTLIRKDLTGEFKMVDVENVPDEPLIPLRCPECGSEATVWIQENKRLGLDLYYCGCQKCGYGRFSHEYGRNGAIYRWNNFVLRYKENVGQPLFKKED